MLNSLMSMGVFALFMSGISLYRLLKDGDRNLLLFRRLWGNRPGRLLHFLSHVVIPFVFAIIFISRGLTENSHGSTYSLQDLSRNVGNIFTESIMSSSQSPPLNDMIEGISFFYTGESVF